MEMSDAEDRDLDEWWAAFEAVNNAIFIATLPWFEEPDIIIEGLLSQAVRCASYESDRDNLKELRGYLHETIDEFINIALEMKE